MSANILLRWLTKCTSIKEEEKTTFHGLWTFGRISWRWGSGGLGLGTKKRVLLQRYPMHVSNVVCIFPRNRKDTLYVYTYTCAASRLAHMPVGDMLASVS